MYHQSELQFNNKKLDPNVNPIGMPFVMSEVGKNTAILSFKTPGWLTILLTISLISWFGVITLKIISKFSKSFNMENLTLSKRKKV